MDVVLNSSNSSSSSEEIDDDFDMDMMLLIFLKEYTHALIDRIPCRTSLLSVKEYIIEILCGNPSQFYESFRMKPHVFLNLCDKLKMLNLLQDSKNVNVEEGLAMDLRILCHDIIQRISGDRFQHSIGTTHTWFKRVLRALKAFGTTVVKPVDPGEVQPEILGNTKWYPYFKCN